MMKVLKNFVCILMVAVLLWWGLSTAEIMCKNLQKEPQYNPCNAWVMMMDMCRK